MLILTYDQKVQTEMIHLADHLLTGQAWATFSDDRRYRFQLGRIWDEALPLCNGLFMNPSDADHLHLDPTTERFKTRCQKLGFGGFIVTNIHAFIETKQNEIRTIDDPSGEGNDETILEVASRCAMVLCGYGANDWSRPHADRIRDMLVAHCPEKLYCLRLTKRGQPEHPLYLRYDLQPIRFPP